MIPNDVKVGAKFYTRISSDDCALVQVVEDTADGSKRYRVKRLDTGSILPKLRGAGQLHLEPGPWGNPIKGAPVKGAAVKLAPVSKPGLVKTMRPSTQAELLKRLEGLPADTRLFLSELIASMTPPSAQAVPAAKIPKHARG